jgi:glycine oxidase
MSISPRPPPALFISHFPHRCNSVMNMLVIGGGVIGLSCAWRLAQGGARVTLLEQRVCGAGASTAALGALWPASPLAHGELQQWHRHCLRNFPAFLSELEQAGGHAVPLQQSGRLEILQSAESATRAHEEIRAAFSEWSDWPALIGPPMELLDDPAARRLAPGIAAPFGALRCNVTAHVNVHTLIAALRAAAIAAGVTLCEQAPVLRIHRANQRITAVETATATIRADTLLLAAGAWTTLLPDLPSAFPALRPAKGQGLALRAPANLRLPCILKRGPIYLVPWLSESQVLVGSTTEPEAAFDETPTAAARELLSQSAADLLPALRNAAILRHWAGLRPDAPRHRPIMKRIPDFENLWLCAGHYKTGIGMAGESGRLMARAILHHEPLPTF